MEHIAITNNLDFILKEIKQGSSAGTIADKLAIKGFVVDPRKINKYLKSHNISREAVKKGNRFIKLTDGTGEIGIKKGNINLY